jgi:diguanylate cyclase (GGDEF)-like protein/PAS domain S-box-containing protein
METILVLDDNRQISDFLVGDVLPSLGYRALAAYDGKSGLELIRQEHKSIDLMLLDLQLPDMTGLDILRQLVQEGLNVPTILFTGHGSVEVAVDAFRLGVQDYLDKGVEIDVLSASISRALTESRLRKETERLTGQLKDQVTWLTVLSKVGKSVTSTLDLDDVLRRIVEAGVLLTRADEGFLALLDNASGQLYLRAVKNIDEDIIKSVRMPVTDSITGMVMRSGQSFRSSQGEAQPLKVSTGFLVYSLIHVPLMSKGQPLGVLAVDNRTTRQSFTPTDEAMLTSLGDYAAVAIDNANLYERAQLELKERKRVETALRESEERYALAVRGANDGIWDWNLRTGLVYYSPRWKAMLGYTEEEVSDKLDEWMSRIHPDDLEKVKKELAVHIKGVTPHFESEYRMRFKNGGYRWMLSRGLAVRDAADTTTRIAGSQTDMTDRKTFEQRLRYDALHDSVTGLFNRTALTERLKFSIDRSRRRKDYLFAVLYLDLDRFKDINDSLGHAMGDQLLMATARMLETILRPTDAVARLGGDEFVILLDDINDVRDATIVAERIHSGLRNTSLLNGHELFVSASIGIVLSTSGYTSPEDILRDADIAMYRAKSQGKDRFEIFDALMRDRIMQRLALENDLRLALERDELRVHYQPILSVHDPQLLGFEALVRWQNPVRGLMMPGDFIGVAEDTGLIINLDRWVLREAIRQMQEWDQTFPSLPTLKLSVNISGKQVAQADLFEEIKLIIEETGWDAQRLNLEITESAVMENYINTVEILAKLQTLGIQIQVDDFGIGYSSLSYLSRFPLNALKIDRSFINALEKDSSHVKIVQAIVTMTHGLGMEVIAEGVESESQLDQLAALGCESVQGYLIARPMDPEHVRDLLKRMFVDHIANTPPWKLSQ